MNRSPAPGLAYFGKLPSRGDFVRSSSQPGLTETLDRWLSRGIESMSADPRWKEVYDRGPRAHFAFFSTASQRAIAGHLVASTDAAGRRFPFVVASGFEGGSLDFFAHSPMALARAWIRFERAANGACSASDASTLLGELAQEEMPLDAMPGVNEPGLRDFNELHSLGSLQAMLCDAGHGIDMRQALLALGLLMEPVLNSAGAPLKKGLRLPLPADPLYRSLVACYWLELIVPFLRRLTLELALFLPWHPDAPRPTLAIGFSGGSAAQLNALLDPERADSAFVDASATDWVEEHVDSDYAVKKLSSYLQQPGLSLQQATTTFREVFLGE